MTDEQDILTRQRPERIGTVVRMLAVVAMIIGAFLIDATTRASWMSPAQETPTVTTHVPSQPEASLDSGADSESLPGSINQGADVIAPDQASFSDPIASELVSIWQHAFSRLDNWKRSWRSAASTTAMRPLTREFVY